MLFAIWVQAWVRRQRSWAEVRWTEVVDSIRVQKVIKGDSNVDQNAQ